MEDQKLSVIPFDTDNLGTGNKLNILDTFEHSPFNSINKINFNRLNRIKSSLRNFKDTIYEDILKINLSYVDITLKQELVLISRRIRGNIL